ncbi:MAG TPA: hypothetical protein VIX86_24670 [Streptosporangiaceae bacterium]
MTRRRLNGHLLIAAVITAVLAAGIWAVVGLGSGPGRPPVPVVTRTYGGQVYRVSPAP